MDSTVAAIPVYFGTMGAEALWLKRRAAERGPTAADYEPRDTATSLAMGVGSLLAPMAVAKVLGPITPGKGRYGKALVATAATAIAATTVADFVARRAPTAQCAPTEEDQDAPGEHSNRPRRRAAARAARRVASIAGPIAVAAGGVAITTAFASRVTANRMWKRRIVRDLGRGPAALGAAILGWDFIYYWNHRFMHESRYMWAIHVVHHSSERYNLSTALRQPVFDAFGTFVPYSLLALLGLHPDVIGQARGINLLYQYWFHTDTIRTLGPLEKVLNTPSHHRVHHGANQQYIDRNHGSILITWDRLFGTFEPEREPVVYGLTKNLDTFNPARVAGHEHFDMLRDVSRSDNWRDRLSFVLRGPGWAYRRHANEANASAAL